MGGRKYRKLRLINSPVTSFRSTLFVFFISLSFLLCARLATIFQRRNDVTKVLIIQPFASSLSSLRLWKISEKKYSSMEKEGALVTSWFHFTALSSHRNFVVSTWGKHGGVKNGKLGGKRQFLSSNFLMIQSRNKLRFVFRKLLWILSRFSCFSFHLLLPFVENWMPLEDFLQYCPAEHGSCRPSHRQGRAVHRMLDGNRWFAEGGKFFKV